MSDSRAWEELVELWKSADGVPDLRGFWARHPELPLAEQMRLLAWHEQCKQAHAGQRPAFGSSTAALPGTEPPVDVGPGQSRLESLRPVPAADQPADVSLMVQQFPELSGEFSACRPDADSPAFSAVEATSVLGHTGDSPARLTDLVDTGIPSIVLGGRYRLDRLLGEGNYGRVWLAFDLELRRQVAVKVPLPKRFQSPADAEQYLVEARTVASLPHHAHLVPVHDVGRTSDGGVYVVSGYVPGTTLQVELSQGLPTLERSVGVLRAIADALLHAHAAGLIHRDVKPANILVESATQSPFLADFGLAVREDDSLAALPAGSPAYMSPEQAVRQGQPLDGRSDLFSLGIIAYELFTGKRPFLGRNLSEMIRLIRYEEPVPPQHVRSDLPAELGRICLKLLQKRPSDRYANGGELMVDLDEWAGQSARGVRPVEVPPIEAVVTPRGLRAFTGDDAGVFLDLLPGLRDRTGLPESGAFWKNHLEATSNTFRVGLVLGVSGAGKSSLFRAGVLPRVSSKVTVICLDATPDRTEADLLRALQNQVAALPRELTLVDAFRWLRQQAGKRGPAKTVVVLDQFEQWLNAQVVQETAELVQALAHSDGGRLQTVLLVREDFGVAANRLLRLLDIPLLENQNWRTIDLFETRHAEQVLIRLGRGYGLLPPPGEDLSEAQLEFCRRGVELLAEKGQVVPVRLALFAELMKRKPWEPATLATYGGAEGIGVAFLEETLGDRAPNPRYREFSGTMQRMLQALLPPPGTEIKGHQRPLPELAAAPGVDVDAPAAREALAILDGELRLITATEAGRDTPGSPARYQLTHDYLVPALRVWLERKQRETKKGRAKLLLSERTALWSVKSEDRHLPTLGEHLRIRWWTKPAERTDAEHKMLSRAAIVHGRGTGLTLMLLAGLVLGGWWFRRQQAQRDFERGIVATVMQLETAQPLDWARVRAPLSAPRAREVARRELEKVFASAAAGGRAPTVGERLAQLRIGGDRSQLEPLREALLTGPLPEFLPTRESLEAYRTELVQNLWTELRDEQGGRDRRLRAGMALAGFTPTQELSKVAEGQAAPTAWTAADATFVVERLLASNPEFQGEMRKALRPVAALLLPEIERKLVDEQLEKVQRNAAAIAVVDYAGGQSKLLARLLPKANPEQFEILFPAFERVVSQESRTELVTQVATLPPADMEPVPRIAFGKARANAATTLLRLEEKEAALKVCDMSDDPESLTQFLFACRPRGVPVGTLLACLNLVSAAAPGTFDPRVRYALLIALGEYPVEELSEIERQRRIEQVAEWYLNDPSSTVHGAAGCLLRQWGATALAEEVERTEVKYVPGREWYTEVVEVQPAQESGVKPPKQKVAMTFIVFPAGEYVIGSVDGEPERYDEENRHNVRLTRAFAVLDRELTYAELIAFNPGFRRVMEQFKAEPRTAGAGANWYAAVAYCRWLGTQQGLAEEEQCYAAPDSPKLKGLKREPNDRFNQFPQAWPVELEGRGYRLPTEAEWEVAARSVAIVEERGVLGRTAYGFGGDSELLTRFGWYNQNSGLRLHIGRERIPGLRGLWDMHGNVMEWVHDSNDDWTSATAIDPVGPQNGGSRVFRGGSWNSDARGVRSALRLQYSAGFEDVILSFRLARVPRS